MKRLTTREILAESFLELAEGKAIDKITVRNIVDNCGYSPATFYRHFKDKYDLVAWEYTRGVAAIMDKIDQNGYKWKQTLLEGAMYYQTHQDYLINLLRHTKGHESFIKYMTDINGEVLKKHILKSSGKEELTSQETMYLRVYCLGTVSLTSEWLLGKHSATPEEIAELYEKTLPLPLRQYLL